MIAENTMQILRSLKYNNWDVQMFELFQHSLSETHIMFTLYASKGQVYMQSFNHVVQLLSNSIRFISICLINRLFQVLLTYETLFVCQIDGVFVLSVFETV